MIQGLLKQSRVQEIMLLVVKKIIVWAKDVLVYVAHVVFAVELAVNIHAARVSAHFLQLRLKFVQRFQKNLGMNANCFSLCIEHMR